MLTVDERAKVDLRRAYHWYEEREVGLGDRFFASYEEACRRIERTPTGHPIACEDVQFVLMRPFPYVIYYRIEERDIVILAVIHGHRDPQLWQSRI